MLSHSRIGALAVWIVAGLYCTAGWAAPAIHFTEKEWDWGEVYSGDTIVHVFPFENKGDEILKIINIATSCGCTAALTTEKEIPPGGTGKIQVTFDTRGHAGRSHKVVYLITNDPSTAQTKLRIHGNIRIDLLIEPRSIYTGFRERDEVHSRQITLTNQGNTPITLLEVLSLNPEISINATGGKTIEPGQKLMVPITLRLPEKSNRLTGQLLLRTDHPRHREEVIPVCVQIMTPVPGQAMEKSPFIEILKKYRQQEQLEQKEQSQEGSSSAPEQEE